MENAQAVELSAEDMKAEGFTNAEIEAELTKRKSAAAPQDKGTQQAQEKPEEVQAKKEAADKEAADLKAAEDKKKADTVIADMLFKKERESKLKLVEETAKKLKEERRAQMTPDQIAAENAELEAERDKTFQKDLDLFAIKHDRALTDLKGSMSPEEWELIMPAIKEQIEGSAYTDAINANADPEKLAADLVAKARGANTEKLVELRLKQKENEAKAREEIETLKTFGGPKSPTDNTKPKTELEQLQAKARSGAPMSSRETKRMIALDAEGY